MIKLEDANIDRKSKIENISKKDVVTSFNFQSIWRCSEIIVESGKRRIPVLNTKKELEGIYTYMDILSAFLKKIDFNKPIVSIMSKNVIFSNYYETLEKVFKKLKITKVGGIPILKNRKVIGIFNERDIIKNFFNVNFGIEIKEVMTPKPFVISFDSSLKDCLKSFIHNKYRRFPVVKDGDLIGIVCASDLFKYLYQRKFDERCLNKKIDEILVKKFAKVYSSQDVSIAVQTLINWDIGGCVVLENEILSGIITERDVLECIE